MNTYKKVTKRNSEKYFQDFIEKKEKSLDWLFDFIEKNGGEKSELDFSPKSLIYLWDKVSNYIERVNPIPNNESNNEELPLWFNLHFEYVSSYTLLSLQLMESLIYYIGEVFIKNNKLQWEIYTKNKPKLDYTNLPVLKLSKNQEIYPFMQLTTFFLDAVDHFSNKNVLYNFYNNVVTYLEAKGSECAKKA